MTKKQIEILKANAHYHGYYMEENKEFHMKELKKIYSVLDDLLDLFIIDRKQADKIRKLIGEAALEGYNDYKKDHAA